MMDRQIDRMNECAGPTMLVWRCGTQKVNFKDVAVSRLLVGSRDGPQVNASSQPAKPFHLPQFPTIEEENA